MPIDKFQRSRPSAPSEAPKNSSNSSSPSNAGDIDITCIDYGRRPDCEQSFLFTSGEQDWYARGTSESPGPWPAPKRCKSCRLAKKMERGGSSGPASFPPRTQESRPAFDDRDNRGGGNDRARGRRNRDDDRDY